MKKIRRESRERAHDLLDEAMDAGLLPLIYICTDPSKCNQSEVMVNMICAKSISPKDAIFILKEFVQVVKI
jgi:hypothetical protein